MRITYKGIFINIPDFFIVGAPRCGTTSLYYYLKSHPQIFMSRVKEPKFFSYMNKEKLLTNMYIINRDIDYFNLFAEMKTEIICGEASTNYLYHYEETITNMKSVYQENIEKVKIIIILRNPIHRALSQYMFFRSYREEDLSFVEAIDPNTIQQRLKDGYSPFFDYIGMGFYYQQVKAYIENFNKVLILIYEDFTKNLEDQIKIVYKFLNVTTNVPISLERYNTGGKYKTKLHEILWQLSRNNIIKGVIKPFVPQHIRGRFVTKFRDFVFASTNIDDYLDKKIYEKLKSIYREDVEKLQELINKPLLKKWNLV